MVMLLDYNTSAIDEMTNDPVVPAKRLRASRDPYAVPFRFGKVGEAFCYRWRRWLCIPAFAGTTAERAT
jgi:hypothetical protein